MLRFSISLLAALSMLSSCKQASTEPATDETPFVWSPEYFSDKKIVRYQVPGFDHLNLDQKKLVYYLTQAGLSGRDIMWDMNYRYNLTIRHALDNIVRNYKGDRESEDWKKFMIYVKNVWFSNGIHHHYSSDKFIPEFSREYFNSLCEATNTVLMEEVMNVLFDPAIDAKRINLEPNSDLVLGSAVNFYDPDITEAEVDAYYASIIDKNDPTPVSYGLNSKLVRGPDGKLMEKVWKVGGMYGPAISEIVKWLEKAAEVAENEPQRYALKLLIEYYKTGDLKKWDEYNIAWSQATAGDIDYINGFVEVYHDPKGFKGSYETIVEINDFEASERMAVVAANAQWFEDHSPIMEAHKKDTVVGVTYKVVNVAGEAGDASPSTPLGVNLPNSDWIRSEYGSKSVSLGNIIEAYDQAEGPGLLAEFSNDQEEIDRAKKYGKLAAKLHTALHEVIGHASGKLEDGVGTPAETLKGYRSSLEEARADLVSLYFLMDEKLVDLGLMPSLEVGKAAYDQYLKNGLMLQLRRIEPGKNIEQAHMRNRQMVAAWVLDKGKADNVVTMEKRDGKTYIEINDYEKLRELFGQLLRETQRIKSQGDYEACRDLFETYGVKVDPAIHAEVLARTVKLNDPPYAGFINPRLIPIIDAEGAITDIKVEYPDDFTEQMLEYGEQYGFLPDKNQ
ncbi:MAG: dihydrofolate reductase [Lewinellaceae bacterium]|nr:dihydrofolate reductase [Lewinellaceae bacterium]